MAALVEYYQHVLGMHGLFSHMLCRFADLELVFKRYNSLSAFS